MTTENQKNVKCTKCGGLGFIITDGEDGRTYCRVCECQKQAICMENIKASGLESFLQEYRFDNFDTKYSWQKQIMAYAKEYLQTPGQNWFALLGQSGAGKTHICTAICGELLHQGKKVKYLRWAVELKRLKMLVPGSVDYDCEIDRILSEDVIYIDDLFKRGKGSLPSNADIQLVFELVDSAIALEKTLILSGEDTFQSLIEIDEAIAGRIKKQCDKYFLQIPKDSTKNYRLKGNNEK